MNSILLWKTKKTCMLHVFFLDKVWFSALGLLNNLYVYGVKAFLAILHFKSDLVVFADLTDKAAYVYKNVR
jgi:hypothetical protein